MVRQTLARASTRDTRLLYLYLGKLSHRSRTWKLHEDSTNTGALTAATTSEGAIRRRVPIHDKTFQETLGMH